MWRYHCRQALQTGIQHIWYSRSFIAWILWPGAVVYQMIHYLRRKMISAYAQQHFPIPIIVIGNLTVGGVGKTPLVIAVAKYLKSQGLRVGIVSRGYGAKIKQFPHHVLASDAPRLVGDEPVLIARHTGCPVVIAPKRVQAVRYLLDKQHSQVIISDDGLQHYAMGRSIEIIVIDGQRKFGNGLCLPAGPLREKSSRLHQADLVVVHDAAWPRAFSMHYVVGSLIKVATGEVVSPESLTTTIAAVAGIGNPESFFKTLQQLGLIFTKYIFPDHHCFQRHELNFPEEIVIMTEKDAVKCQAFATHSWYFLPIEAILDQEFWQELWIRTIKEMKGIHEPKIQSL